MFWDERVDKKLPTVTLQFYGMPHIESNDLRYNKLRRGSYRENSTAQCYVAKRLTKAHL